MLQGSNRDNIWKLSVTISVCAGPWVVSTLCKRELHVSALARPIYEYIWRLLHDEYFLVH